MISRKSTRHISHLYFIGFSHVVDGIWGTRQFNLEALKTFLYENDYEGWFIELVEQSVDEEGDLDKFILGLHTGESLVYAPKVQTVEDRQELGQTYLLRLAKDIFPFAIHISEEEVRGFNEEKQQEKELAKSFVAQLELDGYVYRNRKLYPSESSVIDAEAEQSYLESIVDSQKLRDPETIKHHIQLAGEHYINARYSDSIGNSRHFLEAILAQVLEQISIKLDRNLHSNVYKNATATRDHLEREDLLTTDEKETIGRIYGLLSNTGGHPYIAEKDQARLMWHLALTCSQFVLLRYEGFVKAQS